MRSATASTPWLLVMWLCTLLVIGSACSRQFRPPVSREDFWSCCSGVEDCFAVLQDAEAPGLDPSIHWYRVAPEVICASYGLRVADKRGEILPRLVALLSDPSPRVRDAAAYVLSEMHGPAHDVVPILLEFHEKHPRSQALAELVKLDDLRAAPLLRQYLQEGVTQPSLPCLNDRLAPVLLEELENPESPVWARAQGLPPFCGGPSSEQISRIRELLRRELAQPSLRRPSGASCQEPAPKTCQVVLDGCLPHAASLLRLLRFGLSGEEDAEVLQALARGDERLTPIALNVLVESQSPKALPHLVRQLSSPKEDCRQRALDGFSYFREVPPEAAEVLLGLLERGVPSERVSAAYLLGMLRDERAIEPLRRALKASEPVVQQAAAWALGQFEEKAKAALPELEALARMDPSQDVRWKAAEARYEISGQWEPAATPRCPRVVRYLNGWELRRRAGGRLHLRTDYEGEFRGPPEPSDPCAGPYADAGGSSLVPMGQACLVVGGGIRVREKGRTIVLQDRGSEFYSTYALDFHGMALVLGGGGHMGSYSGHLGRVRRTPEGAWVLESFAPLPGMPLGYAFDERGGLVIATTWRERDEAVCPDQPGTSIVYAVRVTRDGRVGPVE